jgi:hypothetical protein
MSCGLAEDFLDHKSLLKSKCLGRENKGISEIRGSDEARTAGQAISRSRIFPKTLEHNRKAKQETELFPFYSIVPAIFPDFVA